MVYTAEKSDDQYDYREPLPSSILPLCPEVGLVFVNPCIEIPILDVESRSIRNVILDIAKKTVTMMVFCLVKDVRPDNSVQFTTGWITESVTRWVAKPQSQARQKVKASPLRL